jgi:hypothetical protein
MAKVSLGHPEGSNVQIPKYAHSKEERKTSELDPQPMRRKLPEKTEGWSCSILSAALISLK